MKKLFLTLFCGILVLSSFVGCGKEVKNVNLQTVLADINSKYSLDLDAVSDTDSLNKYYNISAEDVKQFAAEIKSDGNDRTEIVLVEAVDSSAADRINSALTTTYNSIVSQYAGYNQEKLPEIKACKVTQDGNYVTMIVASNGPDILDTYYTYFE